MPKITVNGATLHYDDQGAGPQTILFAHGLLWSGALFQFQVAALRSRYRCVTLDFRGQGESEVTASGYDMDTLTDDALALVEKLGLERFHYVGLSMGGFVGMRLALRRPELLRSLVLMNTAADPEPRKNVPKYRAMGAIARLLGLGVLTRPVMKIMFGKPFLVDKTRAGLRAEMERRLKSNRIDGMLHALGGVIYRDPVTEKIGAIKTPTLVIAGAEDKAIAGPRSRAAADGIPGARYLVIPRAGHSSTIEEPVLVNEALEKFFAQHN
jgi:pimeloyl-ACP methyl ester carboxylesterase